MLVFKFASRRTIHREHCSPKTRYDSIAALTESNRRPAKDPLQILFAIPSSDRPGVNTVSGIWHVNLVSVRLVVSW